MAADAYLTCRVTSDTKTRVRALAQRQGLTESAVMKQLLEALLQSAPAGELPPPAPVEPITRRARVHVRLRSEDHRLLRERAQARRMHSATYVSVLVRSHLRGLAPLPKAEYQALRESVLELRAIGRNLNQIARAVNQGSWSTLPGRAEVNAMLKVATGLQDHFRGLLAANERSWKGAANGG
jgi:antitoxin component of RelBE/YafQ-DinJ toxin-antitoxin module